MKLTFRKIILPVILFFNVTLNAQTFALQHRLELEVDPLAYLLNGYSLHAIYNSGHLRYDAGIFAIEQPRSLSRNKRYKAFSSGFGLKINYLFKPLNSFYTGIDIGFGKTKITPDADEDSDTNHDLSVGLHAGYRLFLFAGKESFLKGFYLTPWLGLSCNYFYDKARFEDYREDVVGYFATVHVGYRF